MKLKTGLRKRNKIDKRLAKLTIKKTKHKQPISEKKEIITTNLVDS